MIGATFAWPAVSHASDSSGLFVLLFGVPSLLLAVVFAAVSLKAPRGGATLSAMLLASVLPVYFWAKAMGYGDSAGIWLKLALLVGAIGLVIAIVKLVMAPSHKQAPTDGSK
ncbi:MAG: hypothetical protein ACREST_02255 [Steroidobacteraceae bacterium]